MSAVLLLFICLGLGVFVGRYGKAPAGLAPALNWWVLNIAITALLLHLIPGLEFSWSLWFLCFSMWLVFGVSWVFFAVLGRLAGWSRGQTGALTLMSTLGNTAFVGFPVVEALHGHAGLQFAVVTDQTGSFTVFAIGGSVFASIHTGRSVSVAGVFKRIVSFPPFVAFWCGVVVGALGGWPELLDTTLQRLGSSLTPIALFAIGLQLRLLPQRRQAVPVAVALGWKLLVAPAVVFAASAIAGVHGLERSVAVLEAAMPPAVGAVLLCQQHELEPQLANTILGLGLLIAPATLYIVNATLL
ncbi:MAG: AEC family transporter [Steroidobacteraceae bacterium]